MNLAEFVEESLSEILTGIRAAQKKEGGGAVGAELLAAPSGGFLVNGGTSGMFTIVEFDVSVMAETEKGGKGGLQVWSVGLQAEGKKSDQQTSRVRFAIQMKIPQGDKAPREAQSSSSYETNWKTV